LKLAFLLGLLLLPSSEVLALMLVHGG
jgi:hypothetical protein